MPKQLYDRAPHYTGLGLITHRTLLMGEYCGLIVGLMSLLSFCSFSRRLCFTTIYVSCHSVMLKLNRKQKINQLGPRWTGSGRESSETICCEAGLKCGNFIYDFFLFVWLSLVSVLFYLYEWKYFNISYQQFYTGSVNAGPKAQLVPDYGQVAVIQI